MTSGPPEISEPPVAPGPDGVELHPRKTGRHWLDLAVALSAIVISIVSLMVGIEHGRTERDLVSASSWPYLVSEDHKEQTADGTIVRFRIANRGMGPAVVRSFEMFYRGKLVRGWPQLLNRCCGVPEGLDPDRYRELGVVGDGSPTGVYRPDAFVDLVALRQTPSNQRIWREIADRPGAGVTYDVCYCSVLGQCWRSDLKSLSPRATDSCPVSR